MSEKTSLDGSNSPNSGASAASALALNEVTVQCGRSPPHTPDVLPLPSVVNTARPVTTPQSAATAHPPPTPTDGPLKLAVAQLGKASDTLLYPQQKNTFLSAGMSLFTAYDQLCLEKKSFLKACNDGTPFLTRNCEVGLPFQAKKELAGSTALQAFGAKVSATTLVPTDRIYAKNPLLRRTRSMRERGIFTISEHRSMRERGIFKFGAAFLDQKQYL
jgi:hypothetical protein